MNKKESNFVSDLKRAVAWIVDNPDTDPNAYEMCDLYLRAADYLELVPDSAREDLAFVDRVRMKDYQDRLDISIGHPLFELIANLYDNAVKGVKITDDPIAREAICKIADIFLTIVKEQRKDPTFCYDNKKEYNFLANKMEYCELMEIDLPQECMEMFFEIESQIEKEA